jgi:hypothetical protein
MLYLNFDGLVEQFIQFNAIVNYVHVHFLSTPARKLENHYTDLIFLLRLHTRSIFDIELSHTLWGSISNPNPTTPSRSKPFNLHFR